MNGKAVCGGTLLVFKDSKVLFPRTVPVAWSAVNTQASGHMKKVAITLSLKAFTG
jgi:hypothetical protein